jgi:hypothetical protein
MSVPLWCKSHFSVLEGASHPDELCEEAHRLGLRAPGLVQAFPWRLQLDPMYEGGPPLVSSF